MDFVIESLRNLEAPDPLWLYKVGTSLIKQNADKRAVTSGDSTILEAGAILNTIHDSIKNPHRIPYTETPLEPLIQAIADEAFEFAEVFDCYREEYRHYRQNGGERKYKEYIHDTVALDVLNAYRNSGMMLHLANTGTITPQQLEGAGTAVVRSLDRYGANGLKAMWNFWDKEKGTLLSRLAKDERTIIPESAQSTPNAHSRPYARKDFLALEMKHAKIQDDTEIQLVLEKIIPRTLGPAYQDARDAKESLIAAHITSGRDSTNNDLFIGVNALHPHYDRGQDAVKKKKSASYLYQDKNLDLSTAELENIRAGNPPASFHEMLDAALGGAHPDKAIAQAEVLKLSAQEHDTATSGDTGKEPIALLEDGSQKEHDAAEDTTAPPDEEPAADVEKDEKASPPAASSPSDKRPHHTHAEERAEKLSNMGAATATLGGAVAMAGLLLSSRGDKQAPSNDDKSANAEPVRSEKSPKHYLKPLAFAAAATVTVGGAIMWSKQPKALYEPLKELLEKLIGSGGRGA